MIAEAADNLKVVCETCGITFIVEGPQAKKRKYCDKGCKRKAIQRRYRQQVADNGSPCEICCKPTRKLSPSAKKQGKGRFCGTCSRQATLGIGWEIQKSRNTKISTPCEVCGASAPAVTPRKRALGQGRFCSRVHMLMGTAQQRIEKRRARVVEIRCLLCQRKFKRATSQLSELNFCEQNCYFVYMQTNPKLRLTPEFLRALSDNHGLICPNPNCMNNRCRQRRSKSIWNPWRLCEYHSRLVYSTLRSRRKKREAILAAHDLSVNQEGGRSE